jgi:hypothetical protein
MNIRWIAPAAFLALAACQTVGEVSGESALIGEELDSAVGLYGPWAESLVLDGRQTYVWRRSSTIEGKVYFCELRVETSYRRTVSRAYLQGFPEACGLFSVQYRSEEN